VVNARIGVVGRELIKMEELSAIKGFLVKLELIFKWYTMQVSYNFSDDISIQTLLRKCEFSKDVLLEISLSFRNVFN